MLIFWWPGTASTAAQADGPELLTYEELFLLSKDSPSAALLAKVERLRTTPFVSNEASAGGVKPLKPSAGKLGRVIRVVSWNIEQGLEYEAVESSFGGPSRLSPLLDRSDYPRGGKKRGLVMRQAALLKDADVIVLNEVDWGVKRTGYRNVAAELATALGMNYAYGVEFVEVDPIALGTEAFERLWQEERSELVEQIRVDRSRYRGLHGTAILSRLPLENVRLVPFKRQPYDWYADEREGVRPLEWGTRKASEVAFLEKVTRQIRRGGRMMLMAEAVDPEVPGGRMTVVATHLESRTKPGNRAEQLEELLAQIKDITHPVVVAGDMNTSTRDTTPTSIQREIKKRLGSKKFWLKRGLGWLTGLEIPRSILLSGFNEYRKQADPTVRQL
ncbi:MAG: endonuclease/exonuclease/phosphatase family protein [Acidobacteria bacterium]|nr:endonuclease/exonuclease/phosphatase family protein [Acidobacteriota bacterium]